MKQPTPEQIEASVDNFSEFRECLKIASYDAEANSGHIYEAALFALRFLQKAIGKPSEDALDAAYEAPNCFDDRGIDQSRACEVWDCMRDQMLREVENDA